jgi:hypothetical protein
MQTRSQTNLLKTKSLVKKAVSVKADEQPSSPVTRSQTRQSAPVFDFDESSAEWLRNKNKLGNGTYSYKLSGMTTRSGKVYA